MVKLGPWVSRSTWVSVSGVQERFFTHHSDVVVMVVVVVCVAVVSSLQALLGFGQLLLLMPMLLSEW